MNGVKEGAYYQHYRGNIYLAMSISADEDTHEPRVEYRCQKSGRKFNQPVSRFTQEVQTDHGMAPRFIEVRPERDVNNVLQFIPVPEQ